jgi:hypothetical protein
MEAAEAPADRVPLLLGGSWDDEHVCGLFTGARAQLTLPAAIHSVSWAQGDPLPFLSRFPVVILPPIAVFVLDHISRFTWHELHASVLQRFGGSGAQ